MNRFWQEVSKQSQKALDSGLQTFTARLYYCRVRYCYANVVCQTVSQSVCNQSV